MTMLKELAAELVGMFVAEKRLAIAVLAIVAVAGLLNVNLVFAAFLAGFAVSRKRLGDALENISRFSFALFIPVYFALVGYRLIFGKSFSVATLAE